MSDTIIRNEDTFSGIKRHAENEDGLNTAMPPMKRNKTNVIMDDDDDDNDDVVDKTIENDDDGDIEEDVAIAPSSDFPTFLHAKKDEGTPICTVTIDETKKLQNLFDILGIMETVKMQIIKSRKFQGLSVQSTNEGRTAMCKARLPMDVSIFNPPEGKKRFDIIVHVKTMITLLKTLNPSNKLRLELFDTTTDMVYTSFEFGTNRQYSHGLIKTLDDDGTPHPELNASEYTITVEPNTEVLKRIFSSATSGKCTEINFEVRESRVEKGDKIYIKSYLTIKFIADFLESETTFPSTSVINKGEMVYTIHANNAMPSSVGVRHNVESFDLVYEETFSAEMLNSIMKAMPPQAIKFELKPKNPLIITHDLGGDSICSFIVSPCLLTTE